MKPLLKRFGPVGREGTVPTGADPATVGGVVPDSTHLAPGLVVPVPMPPPSAPPAAPSLLLLLL
jgi:hypothetical protein